MSPDRLRVFVNERPVDLARGATVRDAVAAFDRRLAELVATSAAYVTDGVGRRIDAADPVGEAGGVLRVVVSGRGRAGGKGEERGKGEEGRGEGAVQEAADAVARRLGGLAPRVAIVLGSGLAGLAGEVGDARHIPYTDIPGFPARRQGF